MFLTVLFNLVFIYDKCILNHVVCLNLFFYFRAFTALIVTMSLTIIFGILSLRKPKMDGKTNGTIVEKITPCRIVRSVEGTKSNKRKYKSYHCKVKYEFTVQETKHTGEIVLKQNFRANEGDRVTIRYNTKNPRDHTVNVVNQRETYIILASICSCICSITTLSIMFTNFDYVNHSFRI